MATRLDPVEIVPAKPGISKRDTVLAVGDRWTDGDKVRFKDGKPEKIGGWTTKTTASVTDAIRGALAWNTIALQPFLGFGTHRKLYVADQALEPTDITPIESSGTLTNPFSTTIGLTTVEVDDTAHGRAVGDEAVYDGASAVGGISIDGSYVISSVLDEDTYTIEHSVAASSTAGPGGGSVSYEYILPVGDDDPSEGDGYGAGGYGLGGYGEPSEAGEDSIVFEPRVWNLSRYGDLMLANPGGGGLYLFDPADTPAYQRAEIISNAPTACRVAFVTDERFIFACGVDNDPMNIKWPDQNDPTNWTAGATTTANSRRLRVGTRIIGGKSIGGLLTGILTDAALYQFQYTGSSFIYDSKLVGSNCGLVSPLALVEHLGVLHWMTQLSFYRWGGGAPQEIPNVEDVREYVKNALRLSGFEFKCCGYYNAKFNEIWWFYSTSAEDEPGHYIAVSLADYSWVCGTMERTSGTFFQGSDQRPILAGADGYLYQHEDGNDADGAILRAYIKRAPFRFMKGAQLGRVDGIQSDMFRQVGPMSVEAKAYDRLNDGVLDSERVFFDPNTDLIDLRIGGRIAELTFYSEALGGDFRIGAPLLEVVGNRGRRRG